jgi:MoxR-like ATPase
MRIELGYPDAAAERELLAGRDRRSLLAELPAGLTPDELVAFQLQVETLHVSPALLDYVQELLALSRQSDRFVAGLSPRAGLGLLRAARAWAFLEERDHVLPEDVQAVLPAVVGHRLRARDSLAENASAAMLAAFMEQPIP